MGSGTLLVKMNQLFGSRFIDDKLSNFDRIELTNDELNRFILIEDDLLFSRTSVVPDGVGICSIVRLTDEPLSFESNLIRIRLDKSKCWPELIFRYFQSSMGRNKILSISGGTNVKTIKSSSLGKLEIYLPPFSSQKKIASILSVYDDLIEKNRRRIKLLEESARLLYREWFVHLRFPGQESTRIINGLPEGWTKKPLRDCFTLNYGKALKSEVRTDGPFPVYGSSGIIGSHNKALVEGAGIIVGRKGNVGSVFWATADFWPIDTVYFVNKDESNLYLYYALQSITFTSTDVAVPGLNRDFAYSREILIPEEKILSEFITEATLIRKQIETLEKYSNKLANARGLLLPRLMSGELEV
jgi:type I restriction enzyme S subunit